MKQNLNITELKIVKLICKQMTAKEIAASLGYKPRTIEGYRLEIQKKIKAKNQVGIVLWAVKTGIIKV